MGAPGEATAARRPAGMPSRDGILRAKENRSPLSTGDRAAKGSVGQKNEGASDALRRGLPHRRREVFRVPLKGLCCCSPPWEDEVAGSI